MDKSAIFIASQSKPISTRQSEPRRTGINKLQGTAAGFNSSPRSRGHTHYSTLETGVTQLRSLGFG